MGDALVTPADMEESKLDILGCRQSWMLQEGKGELGTELAGRRGKHTPQEAFPIVKTPQQSLTTA